MSVRLSQLHAKYAHQREVEQTRMQRTQEINRYYDHWGKITTRFSNWTNPEYYKQADKKLQSCRDKAEQERQIAQRRNQLMRIFAEEQARYENEIKMHSRPRTRQPNADTDTLDRLSQSLNEREQLKRKLELEAKLYGRWRYGINDEKLLFDTKSDNQVLAKLNWLDKKIEDQVEKEKEEALAQERKLRLQEEINKREQMKKERAEIREQEIKEIRALQERHMEETKQWQQDSERLKEQEQQLRMFLSELDKERELLDESSEFVLQRPDYTQTYNLKNIKIFIRNRFETYRKQISLCINMLERIKCFATQIAHVEELLEKYRKQLDNEAMAYGKIDTMYESEAKYNLQSSEEAWREQHLARYAEIKALIEAETDNVTAIVEKNVRQQKEIFDMRAKHLAIIENSNEKLQLLHKEEENSPRNSTNDEEKTADTLSVADLELTDDAKDLANNKQAGDLNATMPAKLTDSFSNLNLDCWNNITVRGGIDSPSLNKTRSMNVVTADTAVRPKFARRRVAWT